MWPCESARSVDSRLISLKLSPMETHVCAAPAYLTQQGHPQMPAELAHHDCLALGYRGFERDQWQFRHRQSGEKIPITVNERLRTSNAMALKICALEGMGITLLARWMIGRELCNGALVDLFPAYEVSAAQGDASAWVLYQSRQYVLGKVRAFVDFLKEQFKRGVPWEQNRSYQSPSQRIEQELLKDESTPP